MKRALIIGGSILVVAAIVFASVKAGSSDGEKVYVEAVKTKKIEAVVTAPAEINPSLSINIGAHIVGKIEHLYIKEGDLVRRGQKLVDLEQFAYAAQLQRAQAQLANSRIVGVLFSPGKTFAEIARKPDWVVPALVIIVVVFITTLVTVPRVDFEGTYREAFEAKGVSGQQAEQAIRFAVAFAKGTQYVGPFLLLGVLAVVALIYFLGVRMLGGTGTYQQIFSVVLYGYIPHVIRSLIKIPIMFTKHGLKLQEIDAVVRSSPAFLVSFKSNAVLFTLLSRLELFAIWSLILMVIGLAAVSRLSKAKTAVIVIVAWVLMTLLVVGGAAMGQLKGNR